MRDQTRDSNVTGDDSTAKEPDWSQMARMCFEASQSWLNSSRRAAWNDSLRQFQNEHPNDSKYRSSDFRYRSRLFRPKSRSIVRRSEAAAAAAFFSTADVVSIQARDDDDPKQKASADLNQELLQIRLTSSPEAGGIRWFQTVIGARQDCEVMGAAVAKIHWQYAERLKSSEDRPHLDENGEPALDDEGQPVMERVDTYETRHDRPAVDLIPLENFRVDPGCDWRDPVGTSPYLILRIPMYVVDVREKMEDKDPKTGQPIWKALDDEAIAKAREMDQDTTRRVRESDRQDSKDTQSSKPREYDIVWIHENFIRHRGQDYQFYTLGRAGTLLTEPVPAEEVYFHDPRPFVFGTANIETHKVYPASKMELVKPLQMQANETVNLRLDALKLKLHPRQKVKKGAGVDLSDVRTFMPGKTILLNNPAEDLIWEDAPDISESSYEEQDRINVDFDELSGNFAQASVQPNGPQGIETATGLNLLSGAAATISDYELRIFSETFVEPVLKKLIKAEQKYESDQAILMIAGQKAQLVQKYGIDQITDELLDQEMTVRVNVGIGAADPMRKLANFQVGAQIMGSIFGPTAAQGASFEEVGAEVFGLLGYKDGKRFFQPGFDPAKQMLQQQVQQLQQKLQDSKQIDTPNDIAQTQLGQFKAQHQAVLDAARAQLDRETARAEAADAERKREYERNRLLLERQAHIEDQQRQRETDAAKLAVEEAKLRLEERKLGLAEMSEDSPLSQLQRASEGLNALGQHVTNVGDAIFQRMDDMHARMGNGMLAIANHLNAPKRVVRDAQGNATHVTRGDHAGDTDLEAAVGKLGAPQPLQRGAAGEIVGAG